MTNKEKLLDLYIEDISIKEGLSYVMGNCFIYIKLHPQMKEFNTTGCCNPKLHNIVNLSDKQKQIEEKLEQKNPNGNLLTV